MAVKAIFSQTLPRNEYEVIIINDGSTDNATLILSKLKPQFPFRLIEQENMGAAVARNVGIKAAQNSVIVLIQDDIIATPNFLEEHLKFHRGHSVNRGRPENRGGPGAEAASVATAVVGYTTWHPELKVTPFMRWLEHGGPQFDYDRIRGQTEVDYLAFYTSNLSLRREFVQENGLLDEDFSLPGITAYEDTEWGWRLLKKGLKLYYNPKAMAYHYHPRTLEQVCCRREAEGHMSRLLYRKHPDLRMSGRKDSFWYQLTHLKTGFLSDSFRYQLTRFIFNKFTIWPFIRFARFAETRFNFPLIYKIVCGYSYNRGYGRTFRG